MCTCTAWNAHRISPSEAVYQSILSFEINRGLSAPPGYITFGSRIAPHQDLHRGHSSRPSAFSGTFSPSVLRYGTQWTLFVMEPNEVLRV